MKTLLVTLLALPLGCQLLCADTLITGMFGSPITPQVTAGYAFSFDQNVSVFAVGIYDAGDDGLAGTDTLGIWTDNGTLLTSKLFDSTSSPTLNAHFRWLPLDSPITLAANTVYRTGVFGTDPGLQGSIGAALLSPHINFIAEVGSSSGSFTFPNSSTQRTGGSAYIGPNLQFTIVPEPSMTAFFGIAAILFLIGDKVWRRTNATA
jgi:hypothetical protein